MSTDDILRDSLARLYPAADPTGVAAAIRSRVAAGDTGITPPSSGGGGAAWLPWIGGAVVVGLLGGGAGVTGVFGHPTIDVWEAPVVGVVESAPGLDCPGGTVVTDLIAGSRVLAISRTPDSDWLEVRDPSAPDQLVWVSAAALTPDEDVMSLPESGCVTAAIVADGEPLPPQPAPSSPPTSTPPTSGPGPAPDTTGPALGSPSVSYSPAVGYVCSEQPSYSATVFVTASDNIGVASVAASWSSSQHSGSGSLAPSGGGWALTYQPTGLSITEQVTFTLVATDAAGNVSAPHVAVVQRDQCPG